MDQIPKELMAELNSIIEVSLTEEEVIDKTILLITKYEEFPELQRFFANLLLDPLVLGSYKYGDKKLLRKHPFFIKLKTIVSKIREPNLFLAIIALIDGKNNAVIYNIDIWLSKVEAKTQINNCSDFIYSLVSPFKEGYPGMWTEIGEIFRKNNWLFGSLCG